MDHQGSFRCRSGDFVQLLLHERADGAGLDDALGSGPWSSRCCPAAPAATGSSGGTSRLGRRSRW
jgi:hypothetical protein